MISNNIEWYVFNIAFYGTNFKTKLSTQVTMTLRDKKSFKVKAPHSFFLQFKCTFVKAISTSLARGNTKIPLLYMPVTTRKSQKSAKKSNKQKLSRQMFVSLLP